MKFAIPLLLLVFLGSLVYNIIGITYTSAFTSDLNRPYIIGIGAGICGIILTLIFWRYNKLKKTLDRRKTS